MKKEKTMKLKIDDEVEWRDSWGTASPKVATVSDITTNHVHGTGINVNEVEWWKVKDETVVVCLTNGSWAYGYQIKRIRGNKS